jgi:3-oxoacyl-[acyl-carrier protein] reductase
MASPSDAAERPVALVTGSTRGIGRACAEAFAAAGWAVVVNGTTDEGCAEVASDLANHYAVPTLGHAADAADDQAVDGCYRAIFQRFKRLDALVNNAGISCDGPLGMIPPDRARRAFSVNALGTLFHLQAASRLMRRRGAGAIVNLASIMGTHGAVGAAGYAATKAAVANLTLSAARELGPLGIRVNAVAPGLIETDMLADLKAEVLAERVATIPLKRVGTPEEVADLVLFLASDRARYINGQVIGVDGGMP